MFNLENLLGWYWFWDNLIPFKFFFFKKSRFWLFVVLVVFRFISQNIFFFPKQLLLVQLIAKYATYAIFIIFGKNNQFYKKKYRWEQGSTDHLAGGQLSPSRSLFFCGHWWPGTQRLEIWNSFDRETWS